jgi:site-specific recombinase XerD
MKGFRMWELLSLFLAEKEIMGCAEGTIRYYRRHLKIAFEVMGLREVKDWTSANLNSFLLAKSKTCNTAGLHAHFRAVRAFSNWLYLRERIEKDVMRHVASPKTPKPNPNPLEMDEVRRILAVCKKRRFKHRALALVTLALDTGMRSAEISRLRMEDVDFTGRIITVRGKNGDRRIPVSTKTLGLIKTYIGRERKAHTGETHLFIAAGHSLTPQFVSQYSQRLSLDAGISGKKKGLHSIRATFGVEYLRSSGNDIFGLADIYGHQDIKTTKAYIPPNLEDMKLKHHRHSPLNKL